MFRSGVRLTPREIWELGRMIDQLKWVASLRTPNRRMIEMAFPQSIYDNFPEELSSQTDTGLASLRQLARPDRFNGLPGEGSVPTELPPLEMGIPQRHFLGYQ
jgi:anaerobic magnesium-protoporphyrin IX monomethyl ester cyclase